MNLAVALPNSASPSPGAGRASPPTDSRPLATGSPFAGLLGEQRLALARGAGREAGVEATTPRGDDATADAEADRSDAPTVDAAGSEDCRPATAERPDEEARSELPLLPDWFRAWQPDAVQGPRGLPGAWPAAPEALAGRSADALSTPGEPGPAFAGLAAGNPTTSSRGRPAPTGLGADADLRPGAAGADANGRHRLDDPQDRALERASAEGPASREAAAATPPRAEFALPENRAADLPVAPPATTPALPGPTGPQPGGAMPVLTLATPLASPDFSQALAAQLTTLARDGVHEARLQLNPAEMGPIAVQIVVDGGQAQVDFAAAQAATRQALEASLPSLAAALQTLGLTLSGGGVFDHGAAAGDGRPDAGPSRGAGPDEAAAGGGQPVQLRPRAGLLDLYA